MPVSPPAAGQVFSELRRSQRWTTVCDLAPGGCPASCPDAHRPTHGHRHVRNWATRDIIVVAATCKTFLRPGTFFLRRGGCAYGSFDRGAVGPGNAAS